MACWSVFFFKGLFHFSIFERILEEKCIERCIVERELNLHYYYLECVF